MNNKNEKRDKNMPKIRIETKNASQYNNAVTKCRQWGAIARDGDYGYSPAKGYLVVTTKLGSDAVIQSSRPSYSPSTPYDAEIAYKDFMNATTCPWNSKRTLNASNAGLEGKLADPIVVTKEVHVTKEVIVEVPVPAGVCAQNTLKVKDCTVLTQEPIGFTSLGLPFLTSNGVTVTISDGKPYVLDVKNNGAEELTAEIAAKNAKADLIKGEDSVWTLYAREFDLVTGVTMHKVIESDED